MIELDADLSAFEWDVALISLGLAPGAERGEIEERIASILVHLVLKYGPIPPPLLSDGQMVALGYLEGARQSASDPDAYAFLARLDAALALALGDAFDGAPRPKPC